MGSQATLHPGLRAYQWMMEWIAKPGSIKIGCARYRLIAAGRAPLL